ncbi:MAG TPA: rod shape-determining protein MreC [Candidatus Limnocylindria bacterium]|nr:rod shape-determining protein MreC [Candidatus Limnocylindria bacterium]
MIAGAPRGNRAGRRWAGLTVVSLLLLLVSQTEVALALQRASARALEPARGALVGAGRAVAGVFGTIGEIDRLRGENERLRAELAGARQRIAALDRAADENERLRELLGIRDALDMDVLAVRITGRDPSNFSWELGIDAGTDRGVRPGMPVLGSARGAGALAGLVVDAGPDGARVRLTIDPRSSVVAVDQATGALGEARGQPGGGLVFVQVPVSERVEVGDAIVSAGVSLQPDARSRYPRGLLIGHVEAVEADDNALTQTAFLRPALDPSAVDRLLVVLSFEQG